MFNYPVAVEDVAIEKAQGAYRLREQRPGDFFPLNQEQLVLTDMLRSQPIWGEAEVSAIM